MTDYNDGKWHGWNGVECPVHPKSLVVVLNAINGVLGERTAGITDWKSQTLIAFRVIKPYREPREFWGVVYEDGSFLGDTKKEIIMRRCSSTSIIHLREVIEE